MYKLLFSVFFASMLLLAFTFTTNGKVVTVLDGDTIILLDEDNNQVRVRLEGIDCPEKSQDFGQKAKEATLALVGGKNVKVVQSSTDRYGRVIGMVYVDKVCLNKELVKLGLAWHYKQYNSDPEFSQLESEARALRIGLWSHPNPVEPWNYRHNK